MTVIKLKAGRKMINVVVEDEGEVLSLRYGFNKELTAEIKEMDGAKWHGYDDHNPRKVWTIKNSERNKFQLGFLQHPAYNDPNNPYTWWDRPQTDRHPGKICGKDPYLHQVDLYQHGLTYHYGIWGAEMGTGKTLAVYLVIRDSGMRDILYVAPKSAMLSAKLEYTNWGFDFPIRYVTYEGLKKLVEEWTPGRKAPQFVVFDESSRLKNPIAQRSIAARHLADAVRRDWGKDGFAILMSGSPAPKSPVDWWSQCEVAQPGFLREGDINKLKKRLAIIETREMFAGGGAYPHLVGWRDDEKKCNICNLPADAETHISEGVDVFAVKQTGTYHKFEKGVNEIARLYDRMKGLTRVKFKKDCLDLPDKIYREVELKPTRSTLNAASAIQATAKNSITALTLLRELSDGFQYTSRIVGRQECPVCKGTKTCKEPILEDGASVWYDEHGTMQAWQDGMQSSVVEWAEVACSVCSATGEVDREERTVVEVPTPKEQALKDLLDECDDIGRIVVYGGFTGSIDRISKIVQNQQWKLIRVDGRGWFTDLPIKKPEDMVLAFQREQEKYSRIAFVAHPGSAGMGLTLTAAWLLAYWSNDYNAESRIQSEDRIHRAGMDVNRGATIVDLLHLPTDRKVLNNLKNKKRLQNISMGEIKAVLDQAKAEIER